jgi:hypothetical protein
MQWYFSTMWSMVEKYHCIIRQDFREKGVERTVIVREALGPVHCLPPFTGDCIMLSVKYKVLYSTMLLTTPNWGYIQQDAV